MTDEEQAVLQSRIAELNTQRRFAATQIAAVLCGHLAESVANVHNENERAATAKMIGIVACDVAAEVMEECLKRDW